MMAKRMKPWTRTEAIHHQRVALTSDRVLRHRRRFLGFALLAFVTGFMGGCMPPGPPPSAPITPAPSTPPARGPIGRITELIGTVTLNGVQTQVGALVFNGDKLRTNPGGDATVDLFGHGSVQVGENTDPYFSLRQDGCLVIQVLFGWILPDGSRFCVIHSDGPEVVLNSRALIHVLPARVDVTVLQGTVRVGRVTLALRGEQVTITRGVISPTVRLDDMRLRAYLGRFSRIKEAPRVQ